MSFSEYVKLTEEEWQEFTNAVDNWVYHRVNKNYKEADKWRAKVHGYDMFMSFEEAQKASSTGAFQWLSYYENPEHQRKRLNERNA